MGADETNNEADTPHGRVIRIEAAQVQLHGAPRLAMPAAVDARHARGKRGSADQSACAPPTWPYTAKRLARSPS